MNSIKFLDLGAQYRSVQSEVEPAVLKVLSSTAYVLGPEVAAFEREFAKAHEVEHAIAVNSGTSALHLALLAAGVGASDEVITASMTFVATAAAIAYVGATPVFVDIDKESLTIDPSLIEEKITPRTKAILPVHLHGQAADMEAINRIAEKHNLVVIEDAAQAHGARLGARSVGGLGQLAAFSFYPGKNLGAAGEGGMVTTNDGTLADKVRRLRDWGQSQKFHHDELGFNYRMDGIQGAILGIKLRYLDLWTEARRAHARHYRARLNSLGLTTSIEQPSRLHVYHVFSVFHKERDALRAALDAQGIQTGLHYPIPVHLQKCFAHLGYPKGSLPNTEEAANTQLSLPMYAELKDDEVEQICNVIAEWCSKIA